MCKVWIQRHENNFKASCKVCQKAIDLSNMGRGALISHSQCKGHKKAMALVAGPTMLQFVNTKQVSKKIESLKNSLLTAEEPHSSQQGKSVPGQQSSMKAFTTNEIVIKAEILWSIKSVMAHISSSASADIGDLFEKMFPTSEIASKYACGKNQDELLALLWNCSLLQRETIAKSQRIWVCDNIIWWIPQQRLSEWADGHHCALLPWRQMSVSVLWLTVHGTYHRKGSSGKFEQYTIQTEQ